MEVWQEYFEELLNGEEEGVEDMLVEGRTLVVKTMACWVRI